MWSRRLKFALAILISVFFLYLFFKDIEIDRLTASLRDIGSGWWLLIAAALVQVVHLVLRAARWRILLGPMKKRTGFYNLFSTISIGYLVTMLLPGRLGEVLRPVMLASREKISRGGCLATVLLERLMDALTVATLFALYLIFFLGGDEGGMQSAAARGINLRWGAIAGTAIVLTFPLLWALVHFRAAAARLLERIVPIEGRAGKAVHGIFHGIVDGFEVLKGPRALLGSWFYSFAIWCLIAFSIWFSLLAFDIHIPVAGSLLMMGALTFGIAIPTQGGVGTYEWFGQQALVRFFGVDPSKAAAAVLVMHVFAVMPVILLGLGFLWREGLSLAGLARGEHGAVSGVADTAPPAARQGGAEA